MKEYVAQFGDHKWSTIALLLPGIIKLFYKQKIGRNSKQCRDHYINQLAPNIVKGSWTSDEDKKILECSKMYGTSWTKIRSQLPHRSELDIKNRYNKLIRELIDRGRMLNAEEVIKEVLENPKVYENTKEATEGAKSLELKLEITQEILEMQERIKSTASSTFPPPPPPPPPFSSSSSSTKEFQKNEEESTYRKKPEDFIQKVKIPPHENVIIPGKNSDLAKVLSEEAKRHQKLQGYALNPYDVFKIRNLNKAIFHRMPTRKFGFLPRDIYDEMFMSNRNLPIPDDISNTTHSLHLSLNGPPPLPPPPTSSTLSSTTTSNTNTPSKSSSTTTNTTTTVTDNSSSGGGDPLLPLFRSSTATSASTITTPIGHTVTKRRRQIETNPYIVDWYCPSCGNKNEAGSTECKFSDCEFYNPFISKYEQQLHIMRLQEQLIIMQRENEESMLQMKDLQLEFRRLEEKNEKNPSSKQINRRSRSCGRNRRSSQQPIRRVYNTRQRSSEIEDEEYCGGNDNITQDIQQDQEEEQMKPSTTVSLGGEDEEQLIKSSSTVFINEDESMVPFPFPLLQQNIDKDGKLKPWYCPLCNNKNDLLEDECSVCHGDNPYRLVNINGRIVKKFTFSNIDDSICELQPQEEEPPPISSKVLPIPTPQQQCEEEEDIYREYWICEKCGENNKNNYDLCVKCDNARPNTEVFLVGNYKLANYHNNSNDWTCFHCHCKNGDENYVCMSCGNIRSSALQSIDGNDYDDEEEYCYSVPSRIHPMENVNIVDDNTVK